MLKKMIAVFFVMTAVACSSSSGKGTDTNGTKGDIRVEDSTGDTGVDTQDVARDTPVLVDHGHGETRGDSVVSDVAGDTRTDTGNDLQTGGKDTIKDTAPNDTATDLAVDGFQPPKCTLSPDDQTGYTVDCDKVCAKLIQCSSDISSKADCMFHCKAMRIEMKVSLFNTFGQCILNVDCSKEDPLDHCGESALGKYIAGHMSDVTSQQQADCQALAQAFGNCGNLSDDQVGEIDQNCLAMWVALRPEAVQRVTACKDSACESIRDCYQQALCLDIWELPGGSTSEPVEVEASQDAFIRHDNGDQGDIQIHPQNDLNDNPFADSDNPQGQEDAH